MNTNLVSTKAQSIIEQMMTVNEAGSNAYQLPPKQALAQLVSTGTLNHTFYVDAKSQLDEILALAQRVDSEFLAKLAVYGRRHSRMKDVPVLLLALLSTRQDGQDYFTQAFALVIDNGKQLRNFVQVMRSGVVGRQSLGSRPKKMVNEWLNRANDYRYVSATIGTTPTLRDVLRMTHPKPVDSEKEALFKWTLGKAFEFEHLPQRVQQLITFQKALARQPQAQNAQEQDTASQKNEALVLPDVPLQLLMSLPLTTQHWAQIARQGNFTMVRMNLNTFARHGVFELPEMVEVIAAKLTDQAAIAKSGVFPYQIYTTWAALNESVPDKIKDSLRQAMDTALTNVPVIEGNVVVAVDTSGSMSSSVTGYRPGATSVVRCIDAAALFAAAIKRVNPQAQIMAFDTHLRDIPAFAFRPVDAGQTEGSHKAEKDSATANGSLIARIKSRRNQRQAMRAQSSSKGTGHIDVMQFASALASLGGGGTNVSIPLAQINATKAPVDVMIYFSDNESWADNRGYNGHLSTQMMVEWDKLKRRCPNAKLICVDVQPYTHSQGKERADVLNIGGFGDEVFRLIELFCADKLKPEHWVAEIEQTVLAAS
ncbi:MAG: RNA-binding protein [Psychrobacter sp.]|nr:RNA-binding protein [Psychrobacter sp.]